MSVTSDFLKDRVKGNPKTGQWNSDYSATRKAAIKDGAWLIVCWSNGDRCGFCQATEQCMMDKAFKNWMKTSNAYFLFQCSDDADGGQKVQDWIYKTGEITLYPGFLIAKYDEGISGAIFAQRVDGNTLRKNKRDATGAKNMVAGIKAIMKKVPIDPPEPGPEPTPPVEDFKIRLNESITTTQANKIMDAIDKNDGYCPCQAKSEGTKCHCDDFMNNKGIDDVCICKLYVKKAK